MERGPFVKDLGTNEFYMGASNGDSCGDCDVIRYWFEHRKLHCHSGAVQIRLSN